MSLFSLRSFLTLLKERGREFSDPEQRTRFFQYSVFVVVGATTMTAFGGYSWIHGRYILCLLLFFCAFALCYGWLRIYRNVAQKWVYRSNIFLFTGLIGYLLFLGNNENSMILWVYAAPLANFYMLGRQEGTLITLLVWIFLFLFFFGPLPPETRAGYSLPFAARLLVTYGIVALLTHSIESFRTRYRDELEEKNRDLQREMVERETLSRSLFESQQRYEAVYLHAAEGILLVDLNGYIVECNPQMQEMLGFAEDELLGRSIFSLMTKETLAETAPQLEKLKRGITILIERQLERKDGEIIFCEQSGRKISDDLIILLYRDISERRRAALALEKANRALEELAHLDGLTQIANRRRFDSTIDAEWPRLQREAKALGIIMADIDYFKEYNDIYGHQSGDDCLLAVASLLSSMVNRPADLVARYGGEEFVVLLPDTSLQGCTAIAERMRERIERAAMVHPGSRCAEVVTMSFGVASAVPGECGSSLELLARADKALYQAKELGRNRVC
jgi:diguanylate cyclase (GGDEF)-like protein/PAS domain S-box-containing protein